MDKIPKTLSEKYKVIYIGNLIIIILGFLLRPLQAKREQDAMFKGP